MNKEIFKSTLEGIVYEYAVNYREYRASGRPGCQIACDKLILELYKLVDDYTDFVKEGI